MRKLTDAQANSLLDDAHNDLNSLTCLIEECVSETNDARDDDQNFEPSNALTIALDFRTAMLNALAQYRRDCVGGSFTEIQKQLEFELTMLDSRD